MYLASKTTKTKFLKYFVFAILIQLASTLPGFAKSSAPENMVLINPGGFMRGIDKEKPKEIKSQMSPSQKFKNAAARKSFTDEGPATMIYLSAYYIDKFEVSNAQYTEFIK